MLTQSLCPLLLGSVCYHNLPSVLVKILGVYTVSWSRGGRDKLSALDVIVMPNLFYQKTNVKVFDLKGSERNRYIKQAAKEAAQASPAAPLTPSAAPGVAAATTVPSSMPQPATPAAAEETGRTLLDLNLWEYTHGLPIPVHESSHSLLRMTLHNDSYFLSSLEVIDYSLLVGFDTANSELLVGVIDYIRQYTWDKKLETGMKSMGRIAGQAVPTVINPASYKLRFRAAMERYFMIAPDQCSFFRKIQVSRRRRAAAAAASRCCAHCAAHLSAPLPVCATCVVQEKDEESITAYAVVREDEGRKGSGSTADRGGAAGGSGGGSAPPIAAPVAPQQQAAGSAGPAPAQQPRTGKFRWGS